MKDQVLRDFIASIYDDIVGAMDDVDRESADPQYRLGIRRLAWAFFHKFELFELGTDLPDLVARDVDAWYAGRDAEPRVDEASETNAR